MRQASTKQLVFAFAFVVLVSACLLAPSSSSTREPINPASGSGGATQDVLQVEPVAPPVSDGSGGGGGGGSSSDWDGSMGGDSSDSGGDVPGSMLSTLKAASINKGHLPAFNREGVVDLDDLQDMYLEGKGCADQSDLRTLGLTKVECKRLERVLLLSEEKSEPILLPSRPEKFVEWCFNGQAKQALQLDAMLGSGAAVAEDHQQQQQHQEQTLEEAVPPPPPPCPFATPSEAVQASRATVEFSNFVTAARAGDCRKLKKAARKFLVKWHPDKLTVAWSSCDTETATKPAQAFIMEADDIKDLICSQDASQL
jgi:hypothetical protein